MSGSHVPMLIVLVLAAGLGGVILGLSRFLGPRRPTQAKSDPFECGNTVAAGGIDRVNVKFYLVAILFLVFDIEAVFIYPWAVTFMAAAKGTGPLPAATMLLEMGTFVATILVGLGYAWRKGALDWGRETGSKR